MQTRHCRPYRFLWPLLLLLLPPMVRALDGVWTMEATTGPRYRDGCALAYDSARKVVVLFGGHYTDNGHKYLNDTWTWDGTTWRHLVTSGPPPARSNHTMAYDAARQRVVLFGGSYLSSGTVYLRDTWEWDGSKWSQMSTTGPTARHWHAMAYHQSRARVMLFGGSSATGASVDTWEWNGSSWTQLTGASPSTRSRIAMAYDVAHGRLVLFGGEYYDSGSAKWVRLAETWLWDSVSKWKVQSPAASPPARTSAQMAFDAYSGVGVMFGGIGSDGQALGDTWEWDGSTWKQTSTTGPYARSSMSMAYDSERRRTVIFGSGSDTWEYHVPPYTLAEVAEAMRIYGGLTSPSWDRWRRLNMEWRAGGTMEDVDFMDILKMARKVAGLEANP